MNFLTLDHFIPCVNDTFVAALNDTEVPFVLVEASVLSSGTSPGSVRQPFMLLFRNASAIVFPQQTYLMRHPRIGELGIFLVPIARERDGFLYQAIFN